MISFQFFSIKTGKVGVLTGIRLYVILMFLFVTSSAYSDTEPVVNFRIPETQEMKSKLKEAERSFKDNKNKIAFDALMDYDGILIKEVDKDHELISTELIEQFQSESIARQDTIKKLSEQIDSIKADSGSLEQENAELSRRTLLIVALLIGIGAAGLFTRLRKQKELEAALDHSDQQRKFTDEQISEIVPNVTKVAQLSNRFTDLKERLLKIPSFAMLSDSSNNDRMKRKAASVMNLLHQAEAASNTGNGFSDRLSEEPAFKSSNLNDLIEQMLLLVENSISWPDDIDRPAVKKDLEKILPEIEVDRHRIRFVLFHLLKNAHEALLTRATSDEKGYAPELSVSSRKLPTFIQIRVRDNGKGMDDKEVDSILDAFYSGKKGISSIGIGLTRSYYLVHDVHKGEVIIESDPGTGSDFVVRLPLRRDDT